MERRAEHRVKGDQDPVEELRNIEYLKCTLQSREADAMLECDMAKRRKVRHGLPVVHLEANAALLSSLRSAKP